MTDSVNATIHIAKSHRLTHTPKLVKEYGCPNTRTDKEKQSTKTQQGVYPIWAEWVRRAGRHAGNFLTGDKSQAPRPQTGHTPSR